MQRYDLLMQIHKGLRALLYDTSLALQQCEFGNVTEAEKMLLKLRTGIELLTAHAGNEEIFLFPKIAKIDRALVSVFTAEHEQLAAQSTQLTDVIEVFRLSPGIQTGRLLTAAFNEFMILHLSHMSKEEELFNDCLWAHCTDKEIRFLERRMVSNIAFSQITEFSKWMLLGASNEEAIKLMSKIRRKAPDLLYESVFMIAEKTLPTSRWNYVMHGMYDDLTTA